MIAKVLDSGGSSRARGLAMWRIVVWLLLLLSAFGGLQYLHHGQWVLGQLQAASPADAEARSALHGMLGWDIAYLLAALALLAICAGCLLRQAWARPALRVAALVLAVWLIFSGVLLVIQMNDLERAHVVPPPSAQANVSLQLLLAQIDENYRVTRRSLELALLFKAIAVPVVLWLAWRLGRPLVRAQFRSR